jgi:uncharacterized protein YndB with AHSA1/START domain
MARFKLSGVINRPVEQVFAFVSDLENDPPWSGAAEMRRTSPGPVGIGTAFRQRDRFLGRLQAHSAGRQVSAAVKRRNV